MTNLKKEILIEKGLWKPDKKEQEPLSTQILVCPFCSVQNMKENDYCSKCGKQLKIEHLKATEKKSEQLNLLQEIIAQELEKKGVDLEQMAKILAGKG
jgi:predicted amidophosphoribosyltransferase